MNGLTRHQASKRSGYRYSDAEIARMLDDPPANSWTERCTEAGHPGSTYNPWFDLTWCACGKRVVVGDQATHRWCCGVEPPAPVAEQLELPVRNERKDAATNE